MIRRPVALATLVLVSVSACGGTSPVGSVPPPAAGSPTPASQSAADAAVVNFAGGESLNASFAALHEVERVNPEAVRAAAMANLGSADPDVRFAAVYALGLTAVDGPSADALAGLLDSEVTHERLLAAAGLLPLDRPEAIPVLIDGLTDTTVLAYRDPPRPVWAMARALLLAFTAEDFGLTGAATAEDAAATKPAWEAWWTTNKGTLAYRPDGHRYE